MSGKRKPSKNPKHEREKRSKRAWYHRNQAKVRAQQSRYNEERSAWKYSPRELKKRLFQYEPKDCALSLISAFELRCPSYRIGNLWERWCPMISLTGKTNGLHPSVVSDLNTLLKDVPEEVPDDQAAQLNEAISRIGVQHGLGPNALHSRGIRFTQKSQPKVDENLGEL
jgi:hypothetical protein